MHALFLALWITSVTAFQTGVGTSSEFPVIINGVSTRVRVTDFEASTQDSILLNNGVVTVRSPVAIFILDQESSYTITNYSYYSNCKCWWSRTTVCGGDCPVFADGTCMSHRETGWAWCSASAAWCLSTWPSSKKQYFAHGMRLFDAFTTLNFQSPLARTSNPLHTQGTEADITLRTVSTGKAGQDFSDTAVLRELQPRYRNIENLVWLPHDGSVVTRDQLIKLEAPPKYKTDAVDSYNWDCRDHGKIKADFLYPVLSAQTGFSLYVTNKPAAENLDGWALKKDRIKILTHIGLVPYDGPQLPIVDPCQGTLIRLDSDNGGIIIKSDPALVNGPNCVLIQEGDSKILSLLEFNPSNRLLVPSHRFKGAISPDYFQSYVLRVTTGADFVPTIEVIDLQFTFVMKGSTLAVSMYSPNTTKCLVHFGSNCSSEVVFDQATRNISLDLTNCLPLQSRVDYSCGLASGWVHPPIATTSLNISEVDVEVSASDGFSPQKHPGFDDDIKSFFQYFSFGHVIFGVAILVFAYLVYRGLSAWKGRRLNGGTSTVIYQLPVEQGEQPRQSKRKVTRGK